MRSDEKARRARGAHRKRAAPAVAADQRLHSSRRPAPIAAHSGHRQAGRVGKGWRSMRVRRARRAMSGARVPGISSPRAVRGGRRDDGGERGAPLPAAQPVGGGAVLRRPQSRRRRAKLLLRLGDANTSRPHLALWKLPELWTQSARPQLLGKPKSRFSTATTGRHHRTPSGRHPAKALQLGPDRVARSHTSCPACRRPGSFCYRTQRGRFHEAIHSGG